MAEAALSLALLSLAVELFLGVYLPKVYFRAMAERFSYLSHFPYELYGGTYRGASPALKESLQWFVSFLPSAASVLSFLVIMTLLGETTSLLVLAILGLVFVLVAGIFEGLLFSHGDLVEEKRHLAFSLLHSGSTALYSVIGGLLLVRFYTEAQTRLTGALVVAVILFLFAVVSILPELNPKAAKGLKVEKIEDPSGIDLYVRPHHNALAYGEWAVVAVRLLSSLALSIGALVLAYTVPTL